MCSHIFNMSQTNDTDAFANTSLFCRYTNGARPELSPSPVQLIKPMERRVCLSTKGRSCSSQHHQPFPYTSQSCQITLLHPSTQSGSGPYSLSPNELRSVRWPRSSQSAYISTHRRREFEAQSTIDTSPSNMGMRPRAIIACTGLVLWAGDVKSSLTGKKDSHLHEKKSTEKEPTSSQIERSESLDRRSTTSDLARWNTCSNI
jgi:hypothetical protein